MFRITITEIDDETGAETGRGGITHCSRDGLEKIRKLDGEAAASVDAALHAMECSVGEWKRG